MWQKYISFLLLICLWHFGACITLQARQDNLPDVATTTRSVVAPKYRVSKPEPKQPTMYRVPAHLQDVHKGYVDDDAGDVIRVIEPPQHFQQLKRLIQQKGVDTVWEQQRKLRHNTPTTLGQSLTRAHQPQPPQLVGGAKRLEAKPVPHSKTKSESDSVVQETAHLTSYNHNNKHNNNHNNNNNLQLPLEILASVRKTERQIHGKQRAKLPLVRQRLITKQTHTLLMERAHEQQQYLRAREARLRAAILAARQQHKRVKRSSTGIAHDGVAGSRYDVPHGLQLVARIEELLRSATRLLPDDVEPNVAATRQVQQLRGKPNQSLQQIEELEAKPSQQRQQQLRPEELQIVKEQSALNCNSSDDNNESDRDGDNNRHPRLQMNCAQYFRKSTTTTATTTTTTTKAPIIKKQQTTINISANNNNTSSDAAAAKKRRRLAAARQQAKHSSGRSSSQPGARAIASGRRRANNASKLAEKLIPIDDISLQSSEELLYDDVMTNIRNMLQTPKKETANVTKSRGRVGTDSRKTSRRTTKGDTKRDVQAIGNGSKESTKTENLEQGEGNFLDEELNVKRTATA